MSNLSFSSYNNDEGRKRMISRKTVGIPTALPGSFALRRFKREPSMPVKKETTSRANSYLSQGTTEKPSNPSNSVFRSKDFRLPSADPQSFSDAEIVTSSSKLAADTDEDECSLRTEESAQVRAPPKNTPTKLYVNRRPLKDRLLQNSGGKSTISSSSVSETSSFRRAAQLPSPYEANYSAEDHEPLFDDLGAALFDHTCELSEWAKAIRHSRIVYLASWIEEGIFQDKYYGILQPSQLVLCLHQQFFPKANVAILKCMIRTMQLESMVKELVAPFSAKYPKIANPMSRLAHHTRKEVLKSILFLARVHCAQKFLGNTSLEGNLKAKVHRSFAIVEAHADLTPPKRKGRKPSMERQQQEATNTPRRVSVPGQDPTPLLEEDRKRSHNETSTSITEAQQGSNTTSSKKRRVSLDDLSSDLMGAMAAPTVGPAFMERLDKLEGFFQQGLQALQQLRSDLVQEQRRSEEQRRAEEQRRSQLEEQRRAELEQEQRRAELEKEHRAKQRRKQQQLQLEEQRRAEMEQERAKQQRQMELESPDKGWEEAPLEEEEPLEDSDDDSSLNDRIAAVLDKKRTTEDESDDESVSVQVPRRNSKGTRIRHAVLEEDDDDYSGSGTTEPCTPSPVKQRKPRIQLNLKNKKPTECRSPSEKSAESEDAKRSEEDKALIKEIQDIVKLKVFRNVKFFKKATHLEKACKFVADNLLGGLPQGMSLEAFSEQHGPTIEKAVAKLRNEAQPKMRKVVFEYLDDNDGLLPTVDELTKLRKSATPYELDVFQWFWDSLVECVSGKDLWGLKKNKMLMSATLPGEKTSVVSVADEAYALLAYENYRDYWVACWKKATYGDNVPKKPKYTRTGRRKDGFMPWGQKAHNRFKGLQSIVKDDRAQDKSNNYAAEQRMLLLVQRAG